MDTSGDGTTTATVLAGAIIDEGIRYSAANANLNDIRRGIEYGAKKVVEKLKKKHRNHENVIVVAHGMFLNQLIKAALDIPCKTMRLSVYNASVTKINFCETEPPKLALQNDVSHLSETDGEKLFWM